MASRPANAAERTSSLSEVAQGLVWVSFGFPQGWRFHNLSIEPLPVLHQYQELGIFSPYILSVSFTATCRLSLCTSEKSTDLFLCFLFRWKKLWLNPPSSSQPFPGWTNLASSHSSQTPRAPPSLPILVALCWTRSISPISPHYQGTKPDRVFQLLPHKCQIEGNAPLLRPASYALANATQRAVSPHHTRVHCWFMAAFTHRRSHHPSSKHLQIHL